MEQLAAGEWAREQLRRAPSFAIATAATVLFLLISAFIEYTLPPSALLLPPVEGGIFDDPPPTMRKIEDRNERGKPPTEPKQDFRLPESTGPNWEDKVPDVAPNIDIRVEHIYTDPLLPTEPFPIHATRPVVIATGPGAGVLRDFVNRTPVGRGKASEEAGVGPENDRAIIAALRWLKSVQEEDGSWDARKWGGENCSRDGATGLALLAFLGYGCTDKDPAQFASTVRKAVGFLIKNQSANGKFAGRMYEQGICTMALAETFGMTNNRRARDAAQKGLDYILGHQPPHGGFGYTGAGNDTSVTGFQLQAIKAGLAVGLEVSDLARQRAEKFLEVCLNKDGSTGYHIGQGGRPSMTAASLTARLFLGHSNTAPDCAAQAKWLIQHDHLRIGREAKDYYSIYYLSLASYHMGGSYWASWRDAFGVPLRERQEKEGPMSGSWPVQPSDYGRHGGRVYTTAMACLALEAHLKWVR